MSARAAGGRLEMAADFEDLEIGDALITRGRTITESDLVNFSALTGDWHPQHADAEWAAGSQFGERIAHGMMVLSYAVGLVPFNPERVVALRGFEKVTFKRPTRIGDTIKVEVKVAEKKQLDEGHGLVGFRWKVVNQDRKTACQLKIEALWKIGEIPGGSDSGVVAGSGTGASAAAGGAGATGPASASAAPTGAKPGAVSFSAGNTGIQEVYL